MRNIYSRANLFQFIQTTLRKNKSNSDYLDLENWDKLFVEINVINGSTYVYIIRNNINKYKQRDLLISSSILRDMVGISKFCDNIEFILKSRWVSKKTILDEINEYSNDFDDMRKVDFDSF